MPEASKPQPRRADIQQLAHKIKGAGSTPAPRFSFFLGAGASVESGIPLASAMTADFCQRIIQEQRPEDGTDPKKQQEWLERQPWYIEAKNKGTLYSELFERYERKERGRQFYIEQMIDGKEPSFGYVVLANLMARKYINTILTTNFDDLIYNACSTYTDIRPVVYAYGTMASDLRITSGRPKILKLHGDYLYSKLKNSESELAHQDPNMSRYFSILLNEYGLVVVGYSGCDNSIMELLRKFPSNNDLYWCGRAGSPIPESVRSLLVEVDGSYVEIESFDQMMNAIRSVVGFDVSKMLGSLEARQDQMIEQIQTFPRTLAGLGTLLREVYNYRHASERQQNIRKEEAFLHYVNALEAWQNADFTGAEHEFRASLTLNPDDNNARLSMAAVLCQEGNFAESAVETGKVQTTATGQTAPAAMFQLGYLQMVQGHYSEALAAYTEVIRLTPQDAKAHNGAGVALIGLKRLDEAAAMLRKAVELDPATYYAAFNFAGVLALKGDQAESQKWWLKSSSLWQHHDGIDLYNQAVIQACLGHTDEAIKEMGEAIHRGRPGLARLARESVRFLEAAPISYPGIPALRQMLDRAITSEDTAGVKQKGAQATG